MNVEIQIGLQGADEFANAMEHFDKGLLGHVQTQLTQWAEKVETEATRLAPKKTGYLRSTIYTRTQQGQVKVGAEATYAAAIEFGTLNTRARPFLQPALQNHLPELEHVLLEAVDSARTEARL